jgi:hypothetical protein
MAIRELPRFKIYTADGQLANTLLRFGNDRFFPLFSSPEAARQFISRTVRKLSCSGPLNWVELRDSMIALSGIDDLDAILVDHDGTGRKQTVESFPFSSALRAIKRWDAAGDLDAPVLAYSTPREIEVIGWPENCNIFDANDESEPEMPE